MNRVDLVKTLKLIAPALSRKDWLPLGKYLAFFGRSVVAHNGDIAISVPCATEFSGALLGARLIRMLESSNAETVTMVDDGNGVIALSMKKSRLRISAEPLDDFFVMPQPDPAAKLEIDMVALLDAIRGCMRSITDEISKAYNGMTLIPEGKQVLVFSSNGNALSYASAKAHASKLKNRVVLSAQFCKQMLALHGEGSSLEIHDDYALFSTDKATLWGTVVLPKEQLDFQRIIKSMLSPTNIKTLTRQPVRLKAALDRAMVILEDKNNSDGCANASICDGRLTMSSESASGVAVDNLTFDHPDIKVRFKPAVLRIGCDEFDLLMITSKAIVMTNGNHDRAYFIATQTW